MSWRDIMQSMLPSMGAVPPHVTSAYGVPRKKGTSPHRGVDFNYDVPGQNGVNLKHPAVHSPVDGIVTSAGNGTVGRIAIRDGNGFTHEILHTHTRFVSARDPVAAGQLVGTMGNTGVDKPNIEQGLQHVHYQLKNPAGHIVDPGAFWDQQGPADPVPANPAHLLEYQQYLQGIGHAGSGFDNSPDGATTLAFPPGATRDCSASFDDRFGDRFPSSGCSTAPDLYQPGPPPRTVRRLGVVSGEPFPNYPFPPPIRGLPNSSASRGNDDENWFTRQLGPARWK